MHFDKKQVNVSELEVGMYVCELDRPWLETPFLMQGFLIESAEDIQRLVEYCRYVYIDIAIGKKSCASSLKILSSPEFKFDITSKMSRKEIADLLGYKRSVDYKDTASLKEEIGQAKEALFGLNHSVKHIFSEFSKGAPLKVVSVKTAIAPLVRSVIRNPDASIWLARLKSQDKYIYQHSVATTIWAVALGRELGLPARDLKSLALGALLLDIGKLRLPLKVLNKQSPLDQEEFDLVRSHVNLSVQELDNVPGINPEVKSMVALHHERHNGQGYPNGLSGHDVPLFARIAAVVDCYDAIVSERPYAHPMSAGAAIKKLYEWRDVDFQGALVEMFIQAIGLYPAGSLVMLSSGEVAIVVAESRTRRLRPEVMLILDKDKKPLSELKRINLEQVQTDDAGAALNILESLESGAFGINMDKVNVITTRLGKL